MVLKNRRFLIFITLVFAVAVLAGCVSKTRDPAEKWQRALISQLKNKATHYQINVEFIPDKKTVRGAERVAYTNNEDVALNTVFFHLYPNAFKYKNTLPFTEEDFDKVYPEGFEPGYINIKSVKGMDGLQHDVNGSLLKIMFPEAIQPGEKNEIVIEFEVKIPPCLGRFGYGENTFNLGNWYPIMAVYDSRGWNLDPYYSVGDPFYSECAFYNVTIKAPESYVLATTGEQRGIKKENGFKIWKVAAGPVRDFAFIASDRFKVKQTRVGAVEVNSYCFDERAGEKALDYAAYALKLFSDCFGNYPYKQYSVTACDFYLGGMEYPNVVMIGERFYNDSFLEYVVVHETAHQWWYGLVGNDQIEEAWLDEALTEFSTILYYEKRYGEEKGQEVYKNFILNRYKLFGLTRPGNTRILKPLYEFQGWNDYDALVYAKGAIMIQELRKKVGEKKFEAGMRKLFREYIFDTVTTEDFVSFWEEFSGEQLKTFFEDWLLNKASKIIAPAFGRF